jgi:6-phosphogluconolactonase (cycloisomerase 2 family)
MSASGPSPTTSFIYTETDNSNPGQNAVVAYRRTADGQVTEIGSFKTGGTGLANPLGLLGPDDSDKEVIASPDGHLLFAVNQGSNSVAVFRVRRDGSLDLVKDRAVGSGGAEPVSLSIAHGRLYVLNRGDEVQGQTGTIAPTITVFEIGRHGDLTQDVYATTTLPLGLSPSQVLISSKSDLAFVDTFTPPPLNDVPEANEVVPFRIAADGKLVPIKSGGVGAPVTPPLLLGLAEHPSQPIIYAGLTGASQVGVFTFDGGGNVKLAGTAAVQGAGPCWSLVSPDGKFLYTVDTGTNSVGVFALADPLHPAQIQEFVLGGPQNPTGNPAAPRATTDFEFALDPSGKALYVIDHQTDAAGNFPQGNALHVLTVAANGTLSEGTGSPLFLPVGIPAGADPQGVAVVAASRLDDDPGGDG